MKNILCGIFLLICSLQLHSDELRDKYNRFSNEYKEYFFLNNDKINLYWILLSSHSNQSLGTIIFSPGRTESRLSYFEFATYLQQNNFNVAIIEHRGQGKSGRQINATDVGHIDRFEDYSNDFKLFFQEIKKIQKPPYFLVASSMGAGIAMMDPVTVNYFQRIVMLAPMFKIKTKNIPEWLTHVILNLSLYFKSSTDYAPFTGSFDPSSEFENNDYSSSEKRFKFNLEIYKKNPNFQVGGPSIKWVQEALNVTENIRGKINSVSTKTLLIQSEYEKYVDNQTQDYFCSLMLSCQIYLVSGSKHALHLENDNNIDLIFNKTKSFLVE